MENAKIVLTGFLLGAVCIVGTVAADRAGLVIGALAKAKWQANKEEEDEH